MNQIGERSNTAHPPTTITISHFQFIYFFSICMEAVVKGDFLAALV